MEIASVCCAIPKETCNNFSLFLYFAGETGTRSYIYASTNNTVCSKVAFCNISYMHRSTLTLAVACFFTQQFCHHNVNICTLCNTMTMAPVCRSYIIFFFNCINCPHRCGFFTNIQVAGSVNLAADNELLCLVFKMSYFIHFFKHFNFYFRVQFFKIIPDFMSVYYRVPCFLLAFLNVFQFFYHWHLPYLQEINI